jgi:transposase
VEIVYERVAAIDVHKKQITVAVRTPGDRVGQRRQEVRRYRTFYSALREMTGWLIDEQVTQVAMESTGIYWRRVFHALTETDGPRSAALQRLSRAQRARPKDGRLRRGVA